MSKEFYDALIFAVRIACSAVCIIFGIFAERAARRRQDLFDRVTGAELYIVGVMFLLHAWG